MFFRSDYSQHKEDVAYHFDYLNLLLAGIFDSLARLVGGLLSIGTDRPSFRQTGFLELLKRSTASRASKILTSAEFLSLVDIVHLLRNSIHDRPWNHLTSKLDDNPEHVLISIPDSEDNSDINRELRNLIRDPAWCVSYHGDFGIEPYGWALKTTRDCVAWLENISDALVQDLGVTIVPAMPQAGLLGTAAETQELLARLKLLGA